MQTKRMFPLVIACLVAGCASQSTVTRLAADSTACDPSNITITELGPSHAGTHRYQTQGCGITHNYVCPNWYYFATSALNLAAMSKSDAVIGLDDPIHCVREKR
jgi:hypothetical protein